MENVDLSSIGFGAYRISLKSEKHKQSLLSALNNGVNLIDTSTNYTNGESEELIGNVLSENKNIKPVVISKVGYIQGQTVKTLYDLNRQGKAMEDLVDLGENLKHSIHPDFIERQLDESILRLKNTGPHYYLIHNPEYFFDQEGRENSSDEYYARIEKAFRKLQELTDQKKISGYGISSNTFAISPKEEKYTNLLTLYKIAESIKEDHGFKFIQFPYNLIETGATTYDIEGKSLVQWAKYFGISTLANRPLNAFSPDGFLRIATYEFSDEVLTDHDANEIFMICFNQMKKKWAEQALTSSLEETPLMQQFIKLWKSLPSPDSVDQVFFEHFFPFVGQIWGGSGLSPEQSKPFYLLYDVAKLYSRRHMTVKAREFQEKMIVQGVLNRFDSRPLSVQAISYYLEQGIDHVLVGMRDQTYVDQLKELF